MSQSINAGLSHDHLQALERQGRIRFQQLRQEQVARVLREQRVIRCVRMALTATISASALTGLATLLLMT